MSTRYTQLSGSRLEPAEKILRAAIHVWSHSHDDPTGQGPRAFVTVSRQPGASAISFSHRLAERLNQDAQKDWTAWDRELVEKVSAEHGIAKELIETIPNRHRTWLDDLLHGFSASDLPSSFTEIRAYKHVAMTVRALAAAGHAIIVGQGGVFITEDLPGAIHIRLVAPLDYRIQSTAEREKLTLHDAAARIVEIDKRRDEFYRRFWPGKVMTPETFSLTLNSAQLSVDELVECVAPLIQTRQAARTCCCSEGCGPSAHSVPALA